MVSVPFSAIVAKVCAPSFFEALFSRSGFGYLANAASCAEKADPFTNIVGRESFSVATFYIVEFLK